MCCYLSKTAKFDPINYQNKIMRASLLLSISLFTSLLASTASAQIASPNQFGEARGSYVPKVDVTDRRQMINLYNTYNVRWKDMLSHDETFPTGRTADANNCIAGDISSAFRELIVRQANVYRAIAGLESVKVADKAANDAAQAGALIQQQYWATETRSFNHNPKSTDACYTSIGADASSKSNIALGVFSGPVMPRAYVDDGGSYNAIAGHRSNFLMRNLDKFAVGDVRGAFPALQNGVHSGNLMTPIGRTPVASDNEPVFWPPRNAVLPVEWYPISSNRWSMQCPSCSYAAATVSLKFQGRPVNVSTVVSGGMLIWTIEDPAATYDTKNYASADVETFIRYPENDEVFDVELRGVSFGGVSTNYAYKVTVFDPRVAKYGVFPARDYSGIYDAGEQGESGWGINLSQGTTGNLFLTWYTYTPEGKPLWLVGSGGVWNTPTSFTGRVYQTSGSPYGAQYVTANNTIKDVGSITLDFTDAKTVQVRWEVNSVNGTKIVKRFEQFPVVHRDGMNYSGIWGANLNPAATYETGWGLSITQDFSMLFGVWYTYDDSGKPLWVVMPGGEWKDATTYEGSMYTTTGTSYAVPWNPAAHNVTHVGKMTIQFDAQDDATVTFTVNGKVVRKTIKRFIKF
jgi:hypothetical protein